MFRKRDRAVESATVLGLDGWGLIPYMRQHIFLFSIAVRATLGLARSPIQWVPGALYPEVKRPKRETNQSSPSSAEVKNSGAIPPLPHKSLWRGA
jgi:hypothetical protein